MYNNLPGWYRPVVDAIQAAARSVHLVQHRLRSGWRKRGGACSGPAGWRGRNAVNRMTAANMRAATSRGRGSRSKCIGVRRGRGSRSVGVDVRRR
jgi:hypothetical protein